MPVFPPDLSEALRSLQRQIDQANTARPGPMSWGPGDGHIRFYAADGRVLFQATSAGASIESRGALTGLTPLLDSIRAKDDDQDGRLDGHDSDVSRIDAKNAAQDGTLAQKAWTTYVDQQDSALSGRITTAQSRADNAHSDAATAQSRADSAYSLADAAVTQSEMDSAISSAHSGLPTSAEWDSIVNAVNSMETWLYNNTTYPQDGGIPP